MHTDALTCRNTRILTLMNSRTSILLGSNSLRATALPQFREDICTSVKPQEERLCRGILRRLHEVVEECPAILLVDGHIPAVLVEVDVVWLPRQRSDLVSCLQGALFAVGEPCADPVAYVTHLKRALVATTVPPRPDEFSQLILLGRICVQCSSADDEQSVKERRSIVAPHLHGGEMYVCARFTIRLLWVYISPRSRTEKCFLKEQFWILQWLFIVCKRTAKRFVQLAVRLVHSAVL